MKDLLILFGCVVGSCFGQQPPYDKAFLGVWNLDLSKSKFAAGDGPKGGQVVVNQNGYIATYEDPPVGSPQSVAVAIVRGECHLIGPFGPTTSCTANTDNPRRPSLSIKQGDAVMMKIEVELVGETALIVKSTNLASPTGGPAVSEALYTKATQPPVPTKK